MSKPQETSYNSFKSFFSLLMRRSLLIFILASIFCSECEASVDRNSGDRNETHLSSSEKDYEMTNVSHILFGIGGSVNTWKKRQSYIESWWKPNITRGYVWLDEKISEPWPTTVPPYQVSEDTSRFKFTSWNGHPSAIRLARIVLESFRLGLENVRWFVMGDDDTVFFPENLVSVLRKYDHNEMYYVGGNSESVEQDVAHSYNLAFGGGGYAISYALAVELVKLLDGCINRFSYFYGGDQRIHACLTEIGVPLTIELGFHQMDIRGDPYGMLAAHPVAALVSLHHFDAIEPLFPNRTRLDSVETLLGAYKADPGRTLQQSICYDLERNWTLSIAWGYSAQIYPFLVSAKEMGTALQTFQTWESYSDEPFTFNTRHGYPEPCEQPLIYFLNRVRQVSSGASLTSYTRYVAEPWKDCDRAQYAQVLAVKSIQVSASKLDPKVWTKAPRRQCCQVKRTSGLVNEIQVNVRSCNPGESAAMP